MKIAIYHNTKRSTLKMIGFDHIFHIAHQNKVRGIKSKDKELHIYEIDGCGLSVDNFHNLKSAFDKVVVISVNEIWEV